MFRDNVSVTPSKAKQSLTFKNGTDRLYHNVLKNFLFNNQPDASIIQIYSVIKL
jgi:hypothetical protein